MLFKHMKPTQNPAQDEDKKDKKWSIEKQIPVTMAVFELRSMSAGTSFAVYFEP